MAKKLVFYIIVILFLPVNIYLSTDAGISADEFAHHAHAESVYNYYKTLGENKDCLNPRDTQLQYQGQLPDNFIFFIIKLFDIENIYQARHIFNAIITWLAIFITSLFARRLMGYPAGLITFILLVISPRFLGHGFNNLKDIPYAFAFIFTLYYIYMYAKKAPNIKIKDIILPAAGIGIAIAIRAGGLLLIPFLLLFTLGYLLVQKFDFKNIKQLRKIIFQLFIISISGYMIGIIFWPYALENPFSGPFKALSLMRNYNVAIEQLFEGDLIFSSDLPWYYVPKYLVITIPSVLMIGWISAGIGLLDKRFRPDRYWIYVSLFCFIFPLIYVIFSGSNVYGGWRHMLFIYPFAVIVSATGYQYIHVRMKAKIKGLKNSILVLTGIIILSIHPLWHMFRNHPYEYVYFNELTGGVNDMWKSYETDYYYHSFQEASEWLIDTLELEEVILKDTITIASNFNIDYYFRNHKDNVKTIYKPHILNNRQDYHFAILHTSIFNREQMEKIFFPLPKTVYEVKVDDAVICSVMRGDKKTKAFSEEYLTGLTTDYMKYVTKNNPDNVNAWLSLANHYILGQEYQKARELLADYLKRNPKETKAMNYFGATYLSEGKISEAVEYYETKLISYPKTGSFYINLANAYIAAQRKDFAIEVLQKCIVEIPDMKQAYLYLGHLHKDIGKEEEAKQYFEKAKTLK